MQLYAQIKNDVTTTDAIVVSMYGIQHVDATWETDDYRLSKLPDTTLRKLTDGIEEPDDVPAVVDMIRREDSDIVDDMADEPIHVWEGYILADDATGKQWPVTVYVPSWWA